ncbi:C39 family peptidase [Nocardioides coralli]|uniref:C39 family peptidase n=1 Tax=Nocardioides coralli TaxID=2872154 RepID=UPI001CA3C07A|nr:C39 family peptidase [Nocardioides coralli]QZY28730.1 C39 family peptidase [Nocardioides coralli]
MSPRLLPALVLALVAPLAAAPPATAAPTPRRVDYTEWRGQDLGDGRRFGTEVRRGKVRIVAPVGTRRVGSTTYDVGRWLSPWHEPGFDLTQLIASWTATTPGNSFIEVQVRGRTASGRRSSWDTLARWAATDNHVRRTTISGQADDLARVNVDTWVAGGGLARWQLRVNLLQAGKRSPQLHAIGAMASRLPDVDDVATSKPRFRRGTVLDVPRFSQMVHSGHYPAWGGGGQAWCSPTSTSMVLGYYDALPKPRDYRWVADGHGEAWVDHAARMTYDHGYRGTGNWPFNTAYAARQTGGEAFVTRLTSLRQAERFIRKGIPLIASVSFRSGELSGAPISSTNGHLLVIAGFTDGGDVVVNDPAARSNGSVRRTYDRGQFEDAWLPTSGGLVYVITDGDRALPGGRQTNW